MSRTRMRMRMRRRRSRWTRRSRRWTPSCLRVRSSLQKLSDTFCELNGGPPSAAQVSSIFGGIKTQLAEEAKDEFLELKADKAAEDRDDEEDEDYVPDAHDLAQQAEDDEDVEAEEENEAEEAEAEAEAEAPSTSKSRANSVKILVTPVKRSKSGSRVDIYLRE